MTQGFLLAYFATIPIQCASIGLFVLLCHFWRKPKQYAAIMLSIVGLAVGNYASFENAQSQVNNLGQSRAQVLYGTLLSDPRLTTKGSVMLELGLAMSQNGEGLKASALGTKRFVLGLSQLKDISNLYTGSRVSASITDSGLVKSLRVLEAPPGLLGLRARFLSSVGIYPRLDQSKAWGLWWALCLGRQDFVDTFTKDSFVLAGATHVLALSGTHLSLLGWIVLLLLKRPLGKPLALTLSSGLAIAFVFIAGPYPSVVRALVMFLLASAQLLLYGRVHIANVLLSSVPLSILIFPELVLSLGFWLSVGSLLGIITGIRYLEPFFIKVCKPILGRLLCTGFCAFAATSPILMGAGLSIRPIAIISGIVLVPLTLMFMGFGFLVGLFGSVSPGLKSALDTVFDQFFDLIQIIARLFVF